MEIKIRCWWSCNRFWSVLFKVIICGVTIFILLVFSSISLPWTVRKDLRKVVLFIQCCFPHFSPPDFGIYLSMISKSWGMDNVDSFFHHVLSLMFHTLDTSLLLSRLTLFVSKYSTVSNPECLQCFLELCLSSFSNNFDSRNRFLPLPPAATAGA